MLFSPLRQARHEPSSGKCVRCRDSQGLSVVIAPDRAENGSEGFETVAYDRKEPSAGIRQRQWSWPAPEQCPPAILLQQTDLVADGSRRYAEFGRSLLEAEMPCGSLKRPQFDKRRQLGHVPV